MDVGSDNVYTNSPQEGAPLHAAYNNHVYQEVEEPNHMGKQVGKDPEYASCVSDSMGAVGGDADPTSQPPDIVDDDKDESDEKKTPPVTMKEQGNADVEPSSVYATDVNNKSITTAVIESPQDVDTYDEDLEDLSGVYSVPDQPSEPQHIPPPHNQTPEDDISDLYAVPHKNRNTTQMVPNTLYDSAQF